MRCVPQKTEEQLILIWSRILNAPAAELSINTRFFEIGGNSILVIRLTEMIRNQFSIEFSPKEVFEHSELRLMAELIDTKHWIQSNIDNGEHAMILNSDNENTNPEYFVEDGEI